MKYPKEVGPQSQTEFCAWLFSMLGNAYNLLAQYEADEARRDDERIREAMKRVVPEKRPRPDFSGFSKSEAAHREDEQQ
jgi:hypothetical protein